MTRKTWAIAAGLIVAFAVGWGGAEIRNADNPTPGEVVAQKWQRAIFMLVRNGHNTELLDPSSVQLLVGSSLDGDSTVLAYLYDGLSPALKKQLAFYIPAAQRIALAEGGEDPLHDRQHLLIFSECMQKVQAHGGSVRKCAEEHKGWRPRVPGMAQQPSSVSAESS